MTDGYLDYGTYIKSFYSIICAPSCVKISTLRGDANARVHHNVEWNKAVPKIVSERHRKRE